MRMLGRLRQEGVSARFAKPPKAEGNANWCVYVEADLPQARGPSGLQNHHEPAIVSP